jgi:hypothetical protein
LSVSKYISTWAIFLSHKRYNKPVAEKILLSTFSCMSKQILASTKTNQGEKTTMKIRNLILALSALALPLQAADVGTSYLNLPVAVTKGKTKLVSVFLARPALLKGELVSAVTAGASTFTAYGSNVFGAYTAASEVGTAEQAPASDDLYVVEFTSGPNTGLIKQVLSFSGSTITVKGTLPALTDKTQFILRKDNTLASVFEANVAQGTSTANADVVSVLSSTGILNRFIYLSNYGWRSELARKSTSPNCGNVRISLGTGVAFKSYSDKTINLSGEYLGTRRQISVGTVGAIVGNPYPVAVSLKNSGLDQYLAKDASAANADTIKFLESGSYVQYHHNGTDFVKSTGSVVSNTKELGVGDAFFFAPQSDETIAFAPQVVTK